MDRRAVGVERTENMTYLIKATPGTRNGHLLGQRKLARPPGDDPSAQRPSHSQQ
jgi:hypothetical protein